MVEVYFIKNIKDVQKNIKNNLFYAKNGYKDRTRIYFGKVCNIQILYQTGFSSGVEQLTVVVEYFNSLVSMGRWFDSSKPDKFFLL